MSYDPHKHHRRSIRLKGYDYSQDGIYFVTICVKNGLCLFGDVNERALNAIREYIINNPANWAADQLHPNAMPNKYNTTRKKK